MTNVVSGGDGTSPKVPQKPVKPAPTPTPGTGALRGLTKVAAQTVNTPIPPTPPDTGIISTQTVGASEVIGFAAPPKPLGPTSPTVKSIGAGTVGHKKAVKPATHPFGIGSTAIPKHHKKHPSVAIGNVPPPPNTKYITFTGTYLGIVKFVTVSPAPDSGPLITGGWPIINVIPRPQRVSLTIPVGYDPITMDVPILFDGWTSQDPMDPFNIEADIQNLEWMYGRGGQIAGAQGLGAPPSVYVSTSTPENGLPLELIPNAYQRVAATDGVATAGPQFSWHITSISWDPNPLRIASGQPFGGNRIRQLATVSLQEIVTNAFITTPGSQNAPGSSNLTINYTTKAGDTWISIARKELIGSADVHTVAYAFMNRYFASGGKKLPRGIDAPMPAGVTLHLLAKDRSL